MKKSIRKVLSFTLFGLVVYQSSAVSAITNTSDVKNSDEEISIIQNNEKSNENSKVSNDDAKDAQPHINETKKTFFICENNYTECNIEEGSKTGTGYIEFKDWEDSIIAFKATKNS